MRGVSLLRGREHADTTLNVEHVAPGCEGDENFRYILDEEATGVFQGKITVEQDAQKTDGKDAEPRPAAHRQRRDEQQARA